MLLSDKRRRRVVRTLTRPSTSKTTLFKTKDFGTLTRYKVDPEDIIRSRLRQGGRGALRGASC